MKLVRPPPDEKVSSRVQAVIDWYGPSDLLSMPPNKVSSGCIPVQVANINGAKLLGATVRDLPELAKEASSKKPARSPSRSYLVESFMP